MMLIGEDPRKAINDFSKQFSHDFLQQLKTSHGTKPVHINHFYQEYIAHKEHIHMNSTRWPSLTEYAKHLGREGICKVEEAEKGLHIAWIDNSPDALRRQDAIRRRERMERGDEEREQKMIQEQVERARTSGRSQEEADEEARALQRTEGEKLKLNFGGGLKPQTKPPSPPDTSDGDNLVANQQIGDEAVRDPNVLTPPAEESSVSVDVQPPSAGAGVKVSFGAAKSNKPKNVFAASRSKDSSRKGPLVEQSKKMSEAERIMKEELERKKHRTHGGGPPGKRIKLG